MKLNLLFYVVCIGLASTSALYGQWIQLGSDISGETAGDRAGTAVSINGNGNSIAVGATEADGNVGGSGDVRVYQFTGSGWAQVGSDINGAAYNDSFGQSISLNEDGARIAIGAPNHNGTGYIQVYQFDGSGWVQLGNDINGDAVNDHLGTSVSLNADGTVVAVGIPYSNSNGNEAGRVRVYQLNGANWVQMGGNINGEAAEDQSGRSVSLSDDGNRVAIGAPDNDGNGVQSGHVRIYQFNGVGWAQVGSDINGEVAEDRSGWSVSLSDNGSRIAIGAFYNDGNTGDEYDNRGHVRIYEFNGANWVQVGSDIDGEAANDDSGYSVSLSGDGARVAIGAIGNNNRGHVRIYEFSGMDWVQVAADIDGESINDASGYSVSLSDDGARVVIGAYHNNDGGDDSGHARIFSSSPADINVDVDVSVGPQSGVNTTTGNANVFVGGYSGYSNTEGSSNTFVGNQSGYSNTIGNQNTYIGRAAGYSNTEGSGNVFLGHRAGYNETGSNLLFIDNSDTATPLLWGDFANDGVRVNGTLAIANLPQDDALTRILVADPDGNLNWRSDATLGGGVGAFPSYPESAGDGGGDTNSYFGYEAGVANTDINNTFIGHRSGYNTTTGQDNTFVGQQSGYANTTGGYNTFIGRVSGADNTTGSLNAFLGYVSGVNNTTGSFNTFLGSGSGYSNTTGGSNTFLGYNSGYSGTTAGANTFLGHNSGYSSTTGRNNTFVGAASGFSNTTGPNNVFIGSNSGHQNTAGSQNTFVGRQSGQSNTTGHSNNFMGYQSGLNNIDGYSNTFVGPRSGYDNTTGALNSFFGMDSGEDNVTGSYNVAIGYRALRNNSSGTHHTVIGSNAGVSANGFTNSAAIGNGAMITASNQVRLGNNAVTSIGGYANWTNLSDGRFKKEVREDIPGLAFIEKLRPVSYELDRKKLHTFLHGEDTDALTASAKGGRSIGFIAQEVERVVSENRYVFSGVDKPQNEHDHYGLRYAEFVVPLVKGMQEQQELIKSLQELVNAQQQRIETLESRMYGNTASSGEARSNPPGSEKTKLEGYQLYQNTPNPFDKTTVISAFLPEGAGESKIIVYNLQGLELASYPLKGSGRVSVEISGGRLPSGMYLYALAADGQVIDTKKMLLTN